MENEIIELQHIKLELENGRKQHMRHFIDQFFCYRNNYVTSGGKASWSKITWNEYVSPEANKTRNKKLIVEKEHIMPLKVITKYLVELGKGATLNEIEAVLDKYLKFATITKEEDKILNGNGLRSSMPPQYYEKGHQLYNDLFARYKVAQISIFKSRKN